MLKKPASTLWGYQLRVYYNPFSFLAFLVQGLRHLERQSLETITSSSWPDSLYGVRWSWCKQGKLPMSSGYSSMTQANWNHETLSLPLLRYVSGLSCGEFFIWGNPIYFRMVKSGHLPHSQIFVRRNSEMDMTRDPAAMRDWQVWSNQGDLIKLTKLFPQMSWAHCMCQILC